MAARGGRALMSLGALVGAGFFGYEIGSALDEQFELSDRISGTGKHSREKETAESQASVAGNAAMLKRQAASRKARAAELQAAGASHGQAVFLAEHETDAKGTASRAQADAMAAAIKQAVIDGMKQTQLKVINSTGGPVEVTAAAASSPAAGGQHGG